MSRVFNIAGPCIESRHYMLPPGDRLKDVQPLIDREEYFIIHAPRQSGKTTFLRHLARQLNERGERLAVYVTLEQAQGLRERDEAVPVLIQILHEAAQSARVPPGEAVARESAQRDGSTALRFFLSRWCAELPRPLVLLIDEIDCLTDDALVATLRQIRAGYADREMSPFPSCVVLVGMRDIRDYQARIRPNGETLGTASPFNIAAASLTLRDFTVEEIEQLYSQHTCETGQAFARDAVLRAAHLTQGQPWLVNALARQCVSGIVTEPSQSVTAEHMEQAKEDLILRRPTHLESLMARLREPQVQRVIEPLLQGEGLAVPPDSEEYLLARDLGLIREEGSTVVISNAIYREVIPRFLSAAVQADGRLPEQGAFTTDDLGFDMSELLRSFQQFWRENSEMWLDRYSYREAGPHLVLQAYLQRVVNGVGRIAREYSAGAGRVDLCLIRGKHRYAIEVKAVRPHRGLARTEAEGLSQLAAYLDRLGLDHGYLLLFDQREGRTWDQRLFEKRAEHSGKTITVFGC